VLALKQADNFFLGGRLLGVRGVQPLFGVLDCEAPGLDELFCWMLGKAAHHLIDHDQGPYLAL